MLKKIVGIALASVLALGVVSAHADDEPTGILFNGKGRVVAPYGMEMEGGPHRGVDVLFTDSTVYTPINGFVETLATYDDDLSLVIITNTNVNDSIVVANLKNCPLEEGQEVQVGDVIGEADSNAIHFEYWANGYGHGEPVDPTPFLTLNGTDLER